MKIMNFCRSYFKGPKEILNFKGNTKKQNVCASLKVASLATLIVPLVLGVVYGVSSLYGRVKKNMETAEARRVELVFERVVPRALEKGRVLSQHFGSGSMSINNATYSFSNDSEGLNDSLVYTKGTEFNLQDKNGNIRTVVLPYRKYTFRNGVEA